MKRENARYKAKIRRSIVGTDMEFQTKITLLYRDDKVKLFTELESGYEEYIEIKDNGVILSIIEHALINNIKIY